MGIIFYIFFILSILIIFLVWIQSDKESSSSSTIISGGNKINDFVKIKERGVRKIISILTFFLIFIFIFASMLIMISNK